MKNKLLALTATTSILLLSGCSSLTESLSEDFSMAEPNENGFLFQKDLVADKTFAVTHLNGSLTSDDLNATMNFSKDNKISGRGFCNLYGGEYELDSYHSIEVNDLAFTMKACSDHSNAADYTLGKIMEEPMVVTKTPLGYKLSNENGSLQLMEIQLVVKP